MEVTAPIKDLKVTVNNKQVLSIALPITLAIIIPQINMLTNSIFLGNLSIAALGNAGITGVFYLIFAVAGNGLNNGLQSEFSRYAGADNTSAFKVILAQAVRISLQLAAAGICVTWFIAPFILKQVADPNAYPEEMNFLKIRIMGLPFLYLFQMGNAFLVASLNSRYLMIGFIAEAATNILLDYLLIYGHWGFPAMGFNGAAVASIIAEACGFLVMLLVIYKTGLKREYALLTTFRHDKKTTREIIRISTPLIAQYVISVTTWLVFFIFIEALHDQTAKAISNTMRNVFGLTGVFVWAFAGTCNVMVSNLMGQQKEDKVMGAIKRIMLWSLALCAFMCLLINIFPTVFFSLFGQGKEFVAAGIPVIRMVSCGLLIMSIANIWLNGVTGTGKTTVNLMIEIIAITGYLIYTWIFMKMHYINLTIAWSNELIYWSIIFLLSFTFLRSGRWKTKLE
jgi:putative MATE family efflux protein